MRNYLAIFLCAISLFSCHTDLSRQKSGIKNDIIKTEKGFEKLLNEKGFSEAFYHFASDDAVIHRGGKLIKGRESIREYYEKQSLDNATLTWTPDFVDVAGSGDLAYTYGKYVYTAKDSAGREENIEGIFHTVWKKQQNGDWKYVWD